MSGLIPEVEKTKAAGAGTEAALKNPDLKYGPMGALVQANIEGQRLASACLADLKRYYADPDLLYLTFKRILPESLSAEQRAALRGMCRGLQKRLENVAAGA